MLEIISLESSWPNCDLLTAAGADRPFRRYLFGDFAMSSTSGSKLIDVAAGEPAGEIAELIRRTAEANAALMRGDMRGYLNLIVHADDYTLMAPFGGAPTRGFDLSPERLAELSRFFKGGTSAVELVQSYATDNMVVLAMIERQRGEVGGLPEQDWSLRVTLVYRRDGSQWRLVHRHADPLVRGIGLQQAAAIARGGEGSGVKDDRL
jgi:ketosteroid isomerase-like protein